MNIISFNHAIWKAIPLNRTAKILTRVAIITANTQMDGGGLMRAVMALSGGMDSTGLLVRLLADGYKVSCISYEYGQKHNIELDRAKNNIAYLAENGYDVEKS